MAAWYSKKWVTVFWHVAAWTLLFSLPYLIRQPYEAQRAQPAKQPDANAFLISSILHFVLWITFFYINALVLIPLFIYTRRVWAYVGSIVGCLLLLLVLTGIVFNAVVQPAHFSVRNHILFNFFIFLFMLASSTAYRLIRDKAKADRLVQEKENENLKTELSLLRSQVSPHFMFNVLNNMVALARKRSDQLESSLIKLSSLMRYMLYEADESRVALEKEVEYLQSYIDLQRQRFGPNVAIQTNLVDVDNNYEIEPMLLIPFVENAFKHGTGFIEDPQINIDLSAKNGRLEFCVRNKFSANGEEIKDKTSGIGLANVKRRLNLLYGKNHSLLINKNETWFVTSLKLNLH